MKIPFIPDAAPFNEDQKAWLSGFLAGLHSRAAMPAGQAVAAGTPGGQPAAEAKVTPRLDILFGTQTGSAAALAEDAADVAQDLGVDAHVIGLDDVPMDQLADMKSALIICSTYGEGELPQSAIPFAEALKSGGADLTGIRFAVFGFGDTTYEATYNNGSVVLMQALLKAGAEFIGERGLHDASGLEDPIDIAAPWSVAQIALARAQQPD